MTSPRRGQRLSTQISLDITAKCNLRCMHCYNDSGGGSCEDMPAEELLETVRAIARFHPLQVCLCGGEPTLCPQLSEILDILRGNVCRISMVSNGFVLTREQTRELAERGLHLTQISLDGAYAWQHDSLRGTDGAFDAAVRAIGWLREFGIPVTASILPNKLNCRSLPAYFALCAELGVSYVRAMPFIPTGRGAKYSRRLAPDAEEYACFVRDFKRLGQRYAAIFRAEWLDPVGSVRYIRQQTLKKGYADSINILADGTVLPNIYLPFSVGNIRRTDLRILAERLPQAYADPRMKRYTDGLHQIYDYERLQPALYSDERIDLSGQSCPETEDME